MSIWVKKKLGHVRNKTFANEFNEKNAPHISHPIAFAVSFLSRAFSENEKKRLRRGYARLLTIHNRINDPYRRCEKGFRCKTLVNLNWNKSWDRSHHISNPSTWVNNQFRKMTLTVSGEPAIARLSARRL